MTVDLVTRASAAVVAVLVTPDDGPALRAQLRDEFTTSELETLGTVFHDLGDQCTLVVKQRKAAQARGLAPSEPVVGGDAA